MDSSSEPKLKVDIQVDNSKLRAQAIEISRRLYGKCVLEQLVTDRGAEILGLVLGELPDQFFTEPASTHGYHGAKDGPGGLATHSLQVADCAVEMMTFLGLAGEMKHDALVLAGAFHDGWKRVDRETGLWAERTTPYHGFLASENIRKLVPQSNYYDTIRNDMLLAIATHMTRWGEPKTHPLTSMTPIEIALASADYFVSRAQVTGWTVGAGHTRGEVRW